MECYKFGASVKSYFKSKLREHGVDRKVNVQKICRVCRDKKQVRELLYNIWGKPDKASDFLLETLTRNDVIFTFERKLECRGEETKYPKTYKRL